MDGEVWKEILGYEGLYMISTSGRARSLVGRHGSGRILKPKQTLGYNVVHLWKHGSHKEVKIATLVAAAFIGPRPDGLQVCHNNSMRSDDRIQNLRYDTQKGNFADKKLNGTHPNGEKHGRHKLTESDVRKIREDERTQVAIGAEYGVTNQCIYNVQHRRTWKYLA